MSKSENYSNAMKLRWKNPDYKKKVSILIKKGIKKKWENKKFKTKQSKLYSNRRKEKLKDIKYLQIVKLQLKNANSKLWKNPEYLEKMRNITKDLWKTKKFRNKMSRLATEANKIRWLDNNFKSKMSSLSRELMLKRIGVLNSQNKVIVKTTTGIQEKNILDKIEATQKIKIERQYFVIGYIVDGYCKSNNTVYEVDEPYHFNSLGELRAKDIKRQKEIEQKLNCKFIRIKTIRNEVEA